MKSLLNWILTSIDSELFSIVHAIRGYGRLGNMFCVDCWYWRNRKGERDSECSIYILLNQVDCRRLNIFSLIYNLLCTFINYAFLALQNHKKYILKNNANLKESSFSDFIWAIERIYFDKNSKESKRWIYVTLTRVRIMCSFEFIEVLIRYNGSEVEEEDYCSGPEGNLRRSCSCCWRDLKVGILFKYNKMLEYHSTDTTIFEAIRIYNLPIFTLLSLLSDGVRY